MYAHYCFLGISSFYKHINKTVQAILTKFDTQPLQDKLTRMCVCVCNVWLMSLLLQNAGIHDIL